MMEPLNGYCVATLNLYFKYLYENRYQTYGVSVELFRSKYSNDIPYSDFMDCIKILEMVNVATESTSPILPNTLAYKINDRGIEGYRKHHSFSAFMKFERDLLNEETSKNAKQEVKRKKFATINKVVEYIIMTLRLLFTGTK